MSDNRSPYEKLMEWVATRNVYNLERRLQRAFQGRDLKGPPPTCTYFIWAVGTNAIKIGKTDKDIRRRLGELQVGNHERLVLVLAVPGDCLPENLAHEACANHRRTGEWFSLDPPVRHLISLLKGYRGPGWDLLFSDVVCSCEPGSEYDSGCQMRADLDERPDPRGSLQYTRSTSGVA